MGKSVKKPNPSDQSKLEAELDRLRRRDALLDATEQIANIGHCEWDYETGLIKSCSDGYARILDITLDEVIESHDHIEEFMSRVHPDDNEVYRLAYESLRETGTYEVEYRLVLGDGLIRHIHEASIIASDGDGNDAVALLQDITERKIYEQNLENREALAQQVEAITDIGHFIFDLKSESYIYISKGFAKIHGVDVDEYMSMVQSQADDIEDVHPEDYERLVEVYERHRQYGEAVNVDYRIFRSDGQIRWIREQGTTLQTPGGEIYQSVGVLQDITEQTNTEKNLREARDTLEAMVKSRTRKLADTVKKLEGEIQEREKIAAELDFLANHDALTGLPSLRLCKDRLDQSLAEARRNRQMSAVMFLDLDGFKEINDEHGHEFGDLVLKATAERIRADIRETDTVARIGGDEFVIILSSLPEVAIAERIAGSLIEQIAQAIHIEKVEVAVSASIGISLYPEDGTTAEQLIRSADKAMYQVKHQGKNSFGFVSPPGTAAVTA